MSRASGTEDGGGPGLPGCQAPRQLDHVLSSSPAVLYALAVNGRTLSPTWVSPNLEALFGYPCPDSLRPEWWYGAVHEEDLHRVVREQEGLFADGSLTREFRVRTPDGAVRWVRDTQRLLRDAAGDPIEIVGSWLDVTTRKDAEARLAVSEERYRLLFESNPHPLYLFDGDTLRFLEVNEAMTRHYGYSHEEFLAMTLKDIRRAEEVPLLVDAMARARGAHHPAQCLGTFEHRARDGRLMLMEVAANRIALDGKEAWLALALDVTEKRTLEAQLLQAQKMESVGRLAGGVAHDFNNLLGVITGYAELLGRRMDAPGLRRYVDDILRAAGRAADLTRQLLAFSRKQVLQPKVIDLNGVVTDVANMIQRLIGEDVELRLRLAPDLGAVHADPGQVEQVLLNLAVNARDAMPAGGRLEVETANVDLDAAYARRHGRGTPGRYVCLVVSDTGCGMDAETRAHAFEPFFTTKEPGKGTGLGLATVYGIVKQSGGDVWLYSEPGRGTVFRIFLPRIDATVDPEADRPAPHPESGTETVLLVEDDDDLRAVTTELLEANGYTVVVAGRPEAALTLAASHDRAIDVLVTDVVMPGMNGVALAERLVARHPSLKVLFTSGYTEGVLDAHGVLGDGARLLSKPFTAEALTRALREVLDGRRPAPAAR